MIGKEAFVVWSTKHTKSRSKSPGKATLIGAARVRVLAVDGDLFSVVVLAGSGVPRGLRTTFPRDELYFEHIPAEKEHFEKLVRMFWGDGGSPGPRPEISSE